MAEWSHDRGTILCIFLIAVPDAVIHSASATYLGKELHGVITSLHTNDKLQQTFNETVDEICIRRIGQYFALTSWRDLYAMSTIHITTAFVVENHSCKRNEKEEIETT